MKQVTAELNYLKIAPRKVRLVANTLKGLPLREAEAQLLLHRQRSSQPLLKLLRSAAANAKQNHQMDPDQLRVNSIIVNQGPMLKRFLPRAMGRATAIQKKMSHVKLVLAAAEQPLKQRFVIVPPAKKTKAEKAKAVKAKKAVKPKEEFRQEKPKEKAGFFKRLFRRKSV